MTVIHSCLLKSTILLCKIQLNTLIKQYIHTVVLYYFILPPTCFCSDQAIIRETKYIGNIYRCIITLDSTTHASPNIQDAVASNTDLQCSGMLCSADLKLVTDNLAQSFGPIVKVRGNLTTNPHRVNIPEEWHTQHQIQSLFKINLSRLHIQNISD